MLCFRLRPDSWTLNEPAAGLISHADLKKLSSGAGNAYRRSIYLCSRWQCTYTASEQTYEQSTKVFSRNHDTHWQLHRHAGTDQISISLSWQHTSQLWFHTPKNIHRRGKNKSYHLCPLSFSTTSIRFYMPPPTYAFSRQPNIHFSNMCLTHTHTHIYTLYWLILLLNENFELVGSNNHNTTTQRILCKLQIFICMQMYNYFNVVFLLSTKNPFFVLFMRNVLNSIKMLDFRF